MMKIIKVNGCHDCPYAQHWNNANFEFICSKFDEEGIAVLVEVSGYMRLKTLPDNCPLEDLDIPKLISESKVSTLNKLHEMDVGDW